MCLEACRVKEKLRVGLRLCQGEVCYALVLSPQPPHRRPMLIPADLAPTFFIVIFASRAVVWKEDTRHRSTASPWQLDFAQIRKRGDLVNADARCLHSG